MDCTEAKNYLSAYIDGETDPSLSARYAQHLTACSECRHACEELLQLRATLKSTARVHTLPVQLRMQLQRELAPKKPESSVSKSGFRTWLNAGLLSACSAALAMTLTLALTLPGKSEVLDQEIVASHYRSLLANHLADVASSDHHTVKPWFTGKLDYAPAVNDFSADGFPLIGGRLDYVDKRTVAALAYRHNNHLINVFMWPDSTAKATTGTAATLQGFNLLQWNDAGMSYHAVSDMSAAELEKLRGLLLAAAQK